MPDPILPWQKRLTLLQSGGGSDASAETEYAAANAVSVKRTIQGHDPDSSNVDSATGIHIVFNISSAHIPAFVLASQNEENAPYKNGYDLEKSGTLGTRPVSVRRRMVDAALPLPPHTEPGEIYFGALELNGTGIRYFGDYCLVLKTEVIAADTVVLDRNSYDLVRAPINASVTTHQQRKEKATEWNGKWEKDLPDMCAVRVLDEYGRRARRLTTGMISNAILQDEDYMEVLKVGSFDTKMLAEVRTSASDAALEAMLAQRSIVGPAPRMEFIIWRDRRKLAETALRRAQVSTRVVTTAGRTRS